MLAKRDKPERDKGEQKKKKYRTRETSVLLNCFGEVVNSGFSLELMLANFKPHQKYTLSGDKLSKDKQEFPEKLENKKLGV